MIALDTSALVAVLRLEPEAPTFSRIMADSDRLLVGVATMLELRMVMTGRFDPVTVEDAIAQLPLDIIEQVDFGTAHLAAAISAFDRFGKGRHPASLNFGDCMAYAVARVADCALLYKGDDFARTDIRSALAA